VDPATGVTTAVASDDKGDSPTTVIALTASGNPGAKVFAFAFLAATTGAQTVTVTFSGGTNPTYSELYIWEGAGLTNATIDKNVHAGGSGASADSGTTGTLSAAVELAVAYGTSSGAFTAGGGGWTNVAISPLGSIGEEQVTAATTALNGTGTAGAGDNWDIMCLTFLSSSGIIVNQSFFDEKIFPPRRLGVESQEFATPAQPLPLYQNASMPNAAGVSKTRMIPC
jgi:hypothetical protein